MAAQLPVGDHGKILHATCDFGNQHLTGCDIPAERYGKPQGFDVMLSLEDPQEAERIFAALAEGGWIQMPLQETGLKLLLRGFFHGVGAPRHGGVEIQSLLGVELERGISVVPGK
jgi:hypothetical protein